MSVYLRVRGRGSHGGDTNATGDDSVPSSTRSTALPLRAAPAVELRVRVMSAVSFKPDATTTTTKNNPNIESEQNRNSFNF